MGKARLFTVALAATAAIVALPLMAAAITFSASDATRSASVNFEVIGGELVVTLTNTSPNDAAVTTDILTAVFFTAKGDPLFTKTSAGLTPGSTTTAYPSGTGSGTNATGVGSEWAYLNNLSVFGQNEGLSSSGLGVFGKDDRFDTVTNLEGPDSPDGLQYGITSLGDDQATGNGDIQNSTLIKNSVVFHLDLNGNTFDPYTDITDVRFLYGTALTDTVLTGGCSEGCGVVPLPGTLTLLGTGMLGLLGWTGRRRRR